MGIHHRLCTLVSIIRFYPELKSYFFRHCINVLMAGEDGLSEVCVPLYAPGFALNIACHAHFRDGVFGAQHIRDVAKGRRKQGDLAWQLGG